MTIKGIGKEIVILPVAEVLVSYQGWRGNWHVGVSSQIPASVLIGTDLSKHVKSALVITRSHPEQTEAAGNVTDFQEREGNIPQAEAFSLEIPQEDIFVQKQLADPTLKGCFGKVAGKGLSLKQGLLYREKQLNIVKGELEIRSQLMVPDKYSFIGDAHLCISEIN